jgi:hypothetical protein
MWLPILIFTCVLFCSCHYINTMMGLKDDNVIEETVEDVIEIETGIDVDLTPESVEKK